MYRGAWQATVHGVAKSQDTTDYISVHIGIHLSILFQLLSIIGCYIILSIVPCAMQ